VGRLADVGGSGSFSRAGDDGAGAGLRSLLSGFFLGAEGFSERAFVGRADGVFGFGAGSGLDIRAGVGVTGLGTIPPGVVEGVSDGYA
jgi:hypothetical protein